MADWTVISDTSLDPDAPLTSELAYAWRDNPIAIAEGAPGAPVLTGGWRPWDSVVNGDSNGLIYSAALDGNVTAIESPDMVDGYEYMMALRSPVKTSTNIADLQFGARIESGTLVTLTGLEVSGITGTSIPGCVGHVISRLPRVQGRTFVFESNIINSTTNGLHNVNTQMIGRSADTKIKNLRFQLSDYSFTGTTEVYFYRRPGGVIA